MQDIFPDEWKAELPNFCNVEFRNLDHFRHIVGKLTQKEDNKCGVSYKKALEDLLQGNSLITDEEYVSINNLVKSNLYKRGLITDEVYENYRYTVDGTKVDVDVAKYAGGEPDCVMTPAVEYVDFFYELYVNISYPHYVKDADVRRNVIKLLSTIEELERQHVFIKITLVFPAIGSGYNNEGSDNFFSSIPLFSHRDEKNAHVMSSVLNERLLRKFYFAIMEDTFGKNLNENYGKATQLHRCMNIGDEFKEIEFFELVMNTVKG